MTSQLISVEAEVRLFRKVRYRRTRAILHEHLTQRRLRVGTVIVLSLALWAVIFVIFYEGFSLLAQAIGHAATLTASIHAIYNVFFLTLFSMLAISTGIILFTMLFQSDDTQFLLTKPVRPGRIVEFKFQEAVLFSCWGFVLLGSPLLVAYGLATGASPIYYVLLLPFMVSFSAVAAGLGGIACLLIVRYLGSIRRLIAVGAIAFAAVAVLLFLWNTAHEADITSILWFQRTLNYMRYSEHPALPSWWLSSGLLEAAHANRSANIAESMLRSFGFLCLLLSNALLLSRLIYVVGNRAFRRSFSDMRGFGNRPVRRSLQWLDSAFLVIFRPLPREIRFILWKDIKTFRRDPMHWLQFLLFIGLMFIYLFYMRRFRFDETLHQWMSAIAHLNVGVIGLLLATFMTRFVFPMISLEGRRIWILGTLPIRRRSILISKLVFALSISVIPCGAIIFVSDMALSVTHRSPSVAALHQATSLTLCGGLASIAVGLGARLPMTSESSPSRIAAGFGGTLTLVLSTAYVFSVVALTSLPTFLIRSLPIADSPPWPLLYVSFLIAIGLTAATIYIPLRIGVKAFENAELS